MRLRYAMIGVLAGLVLGLSPPLAQAQETFTVTPLSGPPGTQVTLAGADWSLIGGLSQTEFPLDIRFWYGDQDRQHPPFGEVDLGSIPLSDVSCANGNADCSFSVQTSIPSDALPGGVAFLADDLPALADPRGLVNEADFTVVASTPPPPPPPPPVSQSPPTPTNLSVEALDPTAMEIYWSYSATDETGFTLQQTHGLFVFNVSSSTRTVTEIGLTPGDTYCVVMQAVETGAPSSGWSRPVCATTPTLQQFNLTLFGSAPYGGCPQVILLGARGSGEALGDTTEGNSGLGPEVGEVRDDLATDLAARGISMQASPDTYGADSVDDFKLKPDEPSKLGVSLITGKPQQFWAYYVAHNIDPFLLSIYDGIEQVPSQIPDALVECPHAQFVLAGYSQGAMVMHRVELQLPGTSLQHVAATVLIGDGDRVLNTKATLIGGAPAGEEGIRTYIRRHPVLAKLVPALSHFTVRDVQQPQNTIEVCKLHDIVCDIRLPRWLATKNPLIIIKGVRVGIATHQSYTSDKKLLARVATWVAAKLK